MPRTGDITRAGAADGHDPLTSELVGFSSCRLAAMGKAPCMFLSAVFFVEEALLSG